MKIEEAKIRFEEIETYTHGFYDDVLIKKGDAKVLLDQIDQPKKEVPQCVADLKTDKNQETFEHLMKCIKNLACFGGNAVFVTAPIVIDGNVIVVTVSEPSLNDKKYQHLSPYFNERGSK